MTLQQTNNNNNMTECHENKIKSELIVRCFYVPDQRLPWSLRVTWLRTHNRQWKRLCLSIWQYILYDMNIYIYLYYISYGINLLLPLLLFQLWIPRHCTAGLACVREEQELLFLPCRWIVCVKWIRVEWKNFLVKFRILP